MSHSKEVYIALLDEGVDVWKPVRAEHIQGNVYRILEQPYDPDLETWQFEIGETVECEWVASGEGEILAATKLADQL